jgi:hypothetical protein
MPGDWRPQYVTVFELESLAAYETYHAGPGAAFREEYDQKYGGGGKIARVVMTEDFRLGEPD